MGSDESVGPRDFLKGGNRLYLSIDLVGSALIMNQNPLYHIDHDHWIQDDEFFAHSEPFHSIMVGNTCRKQGIEANTIATSKG